MDDKAKDALLAEILAAQDLPFEPLKPKVPSPSNMVSKEITIEGLAKNAFSGPVVVDEKGEAFYLSNLEEWPAEVLGKRVSVSGIAAVSKLAPDPNSAGDGVIGHGMAGTSSRLRNASWTLAE
jgi:hypothetical protein